jgi:hypothetical protein
MNKIQKTENYDLFKRISGNRTINKAQISRLQASFDENPELISAVPVIVNDKMEIIDGQHRFNALKKLGMPIYYFKVGKLGLKAVQVLNSATKTWSPLDYAKSYSELDKKDYDVYLDFKKRYRFPHNILLSYLGTSSGLDKDVNNTNRKFKEGKFLVKDLQMAETLCSRLSDVKQYYDRGDSRPFASAFKMISSHPLYDHTRMVAKLSAKYKTLKDSPYVEDYLRQLERIYNFHCGVNRVKLF